MLIVGNLILMVALSLNKSHNKANQRGSLKASRKKRATLLTPSYFRRYAPIYMEE